MSKYFYRQRGERGAHFIADMQLGNQMIFTRRLGVWQPLNFLTPDFLTSLWRIRLPQARCRIPGRDERLL